MRSLTFALCISLAMAVHAQDYDREIRPILADHCWACHGPDGRARRADLRLDRREDALAAGVLSPGVPERSELLRRLTCTEPSERMPPPSSKKALGPAQVELLRRWIANGARYTDHWAFIPPRRPTLPDVESASRARGALDHFVMARLQDAGLELGDEATPRELARRISFALRGLPPSATELETFLAEDRPDAYERLVDRWLADPAYGEHRARYWLDLARYADTNGYHFDNYREAWAYRDWVIAAFQRDLAFDRFTIEQLAGDLLDQPTLEQRIATGFNRCNATTNEGGIIDEEYRVLYARERVETLGQTWLGITTGCGACHDHKFDPLSQREFYQLAAFFENTTQPVRDGNVHDTPPVVAVPLPADRQRFDELILDLSRARDAVVERASETHAAFAAWRAHLEEVDWLAEIPGDNVLLHLPLDEGAGHRLRSVRDEAPGSFELVSGTWEAGPGASRALRTEGRAATFADAGDFENDQAFTCATWVSLQPNDRSGALFARMDEANGYRGWDLWMERRHVGMHLIHRWSGDAIKVVSSAPIEANTWTHVAVSYDGTRTASGVRVYVNGVLQPVRVTADGLHGTMRTNAPFHLGQRHGGSSSGAALQDVRIYGRTLDPAEVRALARAAHWRRRVGRDEVLAPDEERALQDYWLTVHDVEHRTRTERVAQLERELAAIRARGTVGHVMQEKEGIAHSYVLARGAYDQRREEVSPATPAFLPRWPDGTRADRLGLARWLMQDDHPLTARVAVNQLWRQVFGRGLVVTPGDFGIAGQVPSNPELLDELAVTFRESAWSVKALLRELVTSATYRQSARAGVHALERDPDNALNSRGPRFRLDAEALRDTALAASGLLVHTLGGPSVKPYQPPGVWEAVAMPESNTRRYERDAGPALYRRSLYTFWKRSAPPASMEIFDAPSRELCTVQRERTNTPLQALVTLNDPQFIEASRAMATSALRHSKETDAVLQRLFERLASRPLDERELALCRSLVDDLTKHYAGHPEDVERLLAIGESPRDAALDPVRVAVFTLVANQFLNLDEVLNQ
ncbi:MAG: DUF1553 domain-containing protein [Planctomycetes bacterium]|nr:DUF1553 domain-containing protein [Planctomycetota bacterium]